MLKNSLASLLIVAFFATWVLVVVEAARVFDGTLVQIERDIVRAYPQPDPQP